MDRPPPLPPSLPSIPAPRKGGLPGCAIAAIVGVPVLIALVAIAAAIAVPAYTMARKKALEAKHPLPVVAPLTEAGKERAMQFARKVSTALNEGDKGTISAFMDFDVITERSFAGMDVAPGTKEEFKQSFGQKSGGLLAQVLEARPKARPLRVHTRDGYPAATLRLRMPGGGVSYVDLLLLPDGDSFKILDLFTYTFANYSTEEARHAMMMVQSLGSDTLSRWLGVKLKDRKTAEQLVSLSRLAAEKNSKALLRVHEQLPPELQRQRSVFILKVQALMALQGGAEPQYEAPYLEALESARGILGEGSAIDLLLLDLYFLKKDYAAAQNCARNGLKAVGPDAYLYLLQGFSAVRAKDLEGAAACLKSAEEIEPEMNDLVDLRLQLRAVRGDFASVVAEVNKFSKAVGVAFTPDIFGDELYAGFRESPEYAAWVASLKR